MVIIQGVGIADLEAKNGGQLSIKINEPVIANIVTGQTLEGIEGLVCAKLIGFLADHKRVGDGNGVAGREGVIQGEVESVRLIIALGLALGGMVVIFDGISVTGRDGGLFVSPDEVDVRAGFDAIDGLLAVMNTIDIIVIKAAESEADTPGLRGVGRKTHGGSRLKTGST